MDLYNKTPLVIVGTGAEARMALDIANSLDIVVYGFLATEADFSDHELNDISVIAQLESDEAQTLLAEDNLMVLVAESDLEKRGDLAEQLQRIKPGLAELRHPSSIVSPYAALGQGNLLHAGVLIQPNVQIGDFNVFHPYVTISPDVEIGHCCTLQTAVHVGREVSIDDEVFIGAGAILYPGIRIGKGAMIGVGSVVLKDVSEGARVFGNPAKKEGK